ncbi:MAG: PHB depolymerase family esterase [Vulcanimicrobiaceae bacterium]
MKQIFLGLAPVRHRKARAMQDFRGFGAACARRCRRVRDVRAHVDRLVLAIVAMLAAAALPAATTPAHAAGSHADVSPHAPRASARSRLASYAIDRSHVFVAGVSSGGFFAVQMHFAHSETFKGAAIYAGGVDACANGSLSLALLDCGGQTLPSGHASYVSTLAESEAFVERQAAIGAIDRTKNVAGAPVYLWSGTRDSVVDPAEMLDLAREYRHFGANVTFERYPAEHAWESPDGEVPCDVKRSPYLIACRAGTRPYDSERTWLTKFFGTLHPRSDGTLTGLHTFDQTEFGATARNSMDAAGYVYVPKTCADGGRCGLVVALHGCLQNRALVGDTFPRQSGIDAWADSNSIVVLYPNVVQSFGLLPYNPQGCWDWWGYDDPAYALKSGTQMTVVYRMVERILAGR